MKKPDFPCLTCVSARTKACDVSTCQILGKYNAAYDLKPESTYPQGSSIDDKKKYDTGYDEDGELDEGYAQKGKNENDLEITDGKHDARSDSKTDEESEVNISSSFKTPDDKQLNEPIDIKEVERYIDWLFRRNIKRLKKVFKQFLKCEKIARLAEIMGQDPRTLHKLFKEKIKKLARHMSEEMDKEVEAATPRKFKERLMGIY